MKFIGLPKIYKRSSEGFRVALGAGLLMSLALICILGAESAFLAPNTTDESTSGSSNTEAFTSDHLNQSVPSLEDRSSDGNTADSETEPVVPETTAPEPTELTGPVITEESATYYATGEVNVRSGPGTDFDIVHTYFRGDVVEVIGSTDNGWKQISTNQFVVAEFLSSSPLETAMSGTYYSIGDVNVRSGPGTDFSITKELSKNSAIDVVAITSNGWYKTVKGTYVLASLCTSTAPPTPTPTPTPTPKPTPVPNTNLDVPALAKSVGLSVNNFELMARVVTAENDSKYADEYAEGLIWVAQVIWNRVNSSKWPDSVYSVIHQSGQFATANTTRTPTDFARLAIVTAYACNTIPHDILFFDSWEPRDENFYRSCAGNNFYYG